MQADKITVLDPRGQPTGKFGRRGEPGSEMMSIFDPKTQPVMDIEDLPRRMAERLDTLEGKKIAMYLSATRDHLYAGKGAELYDILEKRLSEEYPNTEIVHYADLPMKFSPENEVVDAIVKTKPDAVVVGFGG